MHTGRSGPAVAIGLAFVLSVAGCTSAETSLSEPQASRPRVATTVPPAATTPPGPGSTATGSDEASATPSLTSGRRGLVEWIMALGVAGGADIPEETAVALLARGSCAEARKVARDAEQPLPAFYDGAAAACLAAFDGRDDLWAYAEEVASRALPLRDCLDRAVFALLSRLVDIHRKEPHDHAGAEGWRPWRDSSLSAHSATDPRARSSTGRLRTQSRGRSSAACGRDPLHAVYRLRAKGHSDHCPFRRQHRSGLYGPTAAGGS